MNTLFDFDYTDEKGKEMPESDMTAFDSESEAIEYYFNWYRKHGYPQIELGDCDIRRELEELERFDETTIFHDDMFDQSMIGCGFLWGFFPHWVDVQTYGNESVSECWKDDEKLRTLIRKTYRFCKMFEGMRWSTNRIRQNSKVYCAKQAPSNFRPTVAKYLYNAYGDCGSVYDPCGGWGGECSDSLHRTVSGMSVVNRTRQRQKGLSR
jgi:hypothetical protein